ncbi:MAG TPA: outer membrane beta-barrel protein [Candidatus Eisenbacteria bacterium]
MRFTLRSAFVSAVAPLLLMALPGVSGTAWAKGFTLFPFAGYTFPAELDGAGDILPGNIEVKGGLTAGVALGTVTPQNIGIEVMYTYQDNGITFKPVGAPEMDIMDMAIHQIHGNFLFYHPSARHSYTKPYLLIGLGANIFDPGGPNADSETRFTWALGLGFVRQVNEKVGLRVQGRYTPTYLNSSDEGYWCDPYYGCYTVFDSNYLDQWDVTGGLVFTLGN